jgi:hypothetical protein
MSLKNEFETHPVYQKNHKNHSSDKEDMNHIVSSTKNKEVIQGLNFLFCKR